MQQDIGELEIELMKAQKENNLNLIISLCWSLLNKGKIIKYR